MEIGEMTLSERQETNLNPVIVEDAKQGFVDLERKEGSRSLAVDLGMWQFQAQHNGSPEFQEAVRSFLPKIQADPELQEIFLTSYRYREETQQAFDDIFNSGTPLYGEEYNTKVKKFCEITDRSSAFRQQFKPNEKAGKSGKAEEQSVQLPSCLEALKYKKRNESIPDEHRQSCLVCFANLEQ